MLLIAVVLSLCVLFLTGPRSTVALFWGSSADRFKSDKPSRSLTPSDLQALDQTITRHEKAIPNIEEGTEKKITFFSADNPRRTEYCVLYLHGFSASRHEISPVSENIARSLKANHYATRLTGHGLDGAALASATVNDWLFDLAEAWSVAEQLGEKVIVISTSTGGTLATWLAQQPDVKTRLAGMIMISPNYRPNHWAISLFLWPWSTRWMPLLTPKERVWQPSGELDAKYWTYRYPYSVVHGIAALASAVLRSPVEQVTAPTLFIYSDNDEVVDSRETDKVFKRWGSAVKHRISIQPIDGHKNHVITGDIVRPQTTDAVTRDSLLFLQSHVVSATKISSNATE